MTESEQVIGALSDYHQTRTLYSIYFERYLTTGPNQFPFQQWLIQLWRTGDKDALQVSMTENLMQLDPAEAKSALKNDEVRARNQILAEEQNP